MTPEQKAAYIYAQSVSALAEIQGMIAENQNRERRGYSQAYDEQAFAEVPARWGIHSNQIIDFFRS